MDEVVLREIGRIVVRELLGPFIRTMLEEFREEGHAGNSLKAWEEWLKKKGLNLDRTLSLGSHRILDEVTHRTDDLGGGRA